jgi:glycosyltransferase involved in cell wall biosynthesis
MPICGGQNEGARMTAGMTGPIAYITGEYPKVSHTFIQREIMALRALGITVVTASVRRPDPKTVVGAEQQAEARATFGVIEAARSPLRLLAAHGRMIRRSPSRWLGAFHLAWKTRAPGVKSTLYQLFYALEAGVLADHLLSQGVTHLHNHFGDASGNLTLITAHMAGLPFSITLHGPTVFFEPYRWHLGVKTQRAAFIACISHYCRSQAMLFSSEADWGKLRIVHCGIRPEAYRQAVGGPGGEGGHMVFVGRLEPVKGVPLLLEAFARIAATHPGARLTIAGDGGVRARLMARAEALGLADRIHFPGYLDEAQVADLLASADMMVLPSFAEGLPVVLMEAMASGLPVIATQIAGVPELVVDGVSGLIVPPGDVAGLARAMDRLLADADLRAAMGQAGRAQVLAQHDIRAEAAWLAALFAGRGQGLRPEGHPEVHPEVAP